MSTPSLLDALALLGVAPDATEAQIRTAYRKRSLQLHPDKAKDVPPDIAAERFHSLTLAFESLMDPDTRASMRERAEQELARKQRQSAFDDRRRAMAADLERREAEDRQARVERAAREKERAQLVAALREAGLNMRVERHERLLRDWQHAAASKKRRHSEAAAPPVGENDGRVLVRFPVDQRNELLGDAAADDVSASPLAGALAQTYGDVKAIHMRPSRKQRSEVSVIAVFSSVGDAWRAVNDGGDLRCPHPLLADAWIGWCDASGRAGAPPAYFRYGSTLSAAFV
ncbi:hypothetical protein MCUN1_002929 [Malassezia cuniculi]|uniref:J domain-containing protein n=1 Tax=Malassezia cuniculi TaxID=948313 RepID=A0AAF0J7B2_9BASI|nr:hypothetical protein MCUN1_002929 [Malassezia cuniculi]